MGISTEDTATDVSKGDLLTEFEPFNQRKYAFTAVPHGAVGWLLRNVWVIPLSMILLIALVNISAFQIIKDDRIAIDIALARANDSGHYYKVNEYIHYFESKSDLYFFDCIADYSEGYWVITFSNDKTEPFTTTNNVQCTTNNTWLTAKLYADARVYLIPFFLILTCAGILYSYFIRRAPKSFYMLAKTNRLISREGHAGKPKRIQPKGSFTYVRDFESAIQSPLGKIFALIFSFLMYVLVYYFVIQRNSIDIIQTGFLPMIVGEIVLMFIFPLVLSLLAGLGLWVILIVGTYLGWLTSTFKLNIQPYGSDGCGGLKPIGDIALMMALIYIIPGILFGIFTLRGLLDRSIPAVTYLTYYVLPLLLIVALVTFLLPVIRVHREMTRQRKAFQDTYLERASTSLEAVKDRLRQLVALGEDQGEEGQALKYRLELLEKLYPTEVIFRTWPFGRGILVIFAVGQSLQLIQYIAGQIVIYFQVIQNG